MSMRRIYRKVAKEYGVTPKEVRQEIQHCITAAYTDPLNQNEITKAYQKRVPCKGSIPTPEEFLRYMADNVTLVNNTRNLLTAGSECCCLKGGSYG